MRAPSRSAPAGRPRATGSSAGSRLFRQPGPPLCLVAPAAAHGVLANDTDPIAGDTLHVSAVNGQAANVAHTIAGTFGSLTLNADGSYTYTASSSAALPASGVGQDVFTYTASTGQGGTADSTLTVNVTATGITYLGGTPGTTITSPGLALADCAGMSAFTESIGG
jgi:VCBS repeat-containing protein